MTHWCSVSNRLCFLKVPRLLTARRSLQAMVGPLANSCYAAVSDLGASRRASDNILTNLMIVNIRFIARLNVQAIRYTALVHVKDYVPDCLGHKCNNMFHGLCLTSNDALDFSSSSLQIPGTNLSFKHSPQNMPPGYVC